MNIRNFVISVFTLFFLFSCTADAGNKADRYIIATRESLKNDAEWINVVRELQKRHPGSEVIYYESSLKELLPSLKELTPRYLCVVDKPLNLNRDFVIEGNRICRQVDDDIYDDYIWGIITGYSPGDALRIVAQSAEPFVIKSALSSVSDVSSGRWFDRFAWVDDGTKGKWGEKINANDSIHVYKTDKLENLLPIFLEKWREIDPDLILSASHATQFNLEMPFSSGNIKSRDGQLYAELATPEDVPGTGKPRVYFPVGNCLIGDMKNTPQSMAAAWLSSGGATAMLGYVVSTWHGRNGWGALKFFLSAPEKHTLAEAAYLNRQDMLTQEFRKDPRFLHIVPNFAKYGDMAFREIEYHLYQLLNEAPSKDDLGFVYDRDVVVYYGDPAWNVRTKHVPGYDGYDFVFSKKGKKYYIELRTKDNFSIEKVSGKGFKEMHVLDIPIAYFFPERVSSPSVVSNESNLDIAFDENFLLIYNKNLEPGKTYRFIIESD